MASDDAAQAVKDATNQLLTATVAGDAETYSELAADELIYIHSMGLRDDKRSIVEKIAAGTYKAVASLDFDCEKIWVFGDVAVALGQVVPVAHEGSTAPRPVSSLDVWRRVDSRWELLVHHLTATPAPQ